MIIYMESTITLIAQTDMESAQLLMQSGEVKRTETGVNYIKIDYEA